MRADIQVPMRIEAIHFEENLYSNGMYIKKKSASGLCVRARQPKGYLSALQVISA